MIPLLDPNAGPLYGLSANVAPPPLAAILSIAMILGVDWLGLMVLRKLRLRDFGKRPWLRWQAPATGAALLAMVLYPAALAGGFSRLVAQPVAGAIALIGLAHGWRSAVQLRHAPKGGVLNILFWLVVAGLGLLALGPVTEADSLDYHVGVALRILNDGAFPFAPEWFHSRLAGSGEVLIALGLAIGAEQFGSLLQYAGVLGIVGIFKYGLSGNAPTPREPAEQWKAVIALAAVSSPVFLAWVASPKPMLLPVAMTTAALMVAVSILAGKQDEVAPSQLRNAFALTCLLVMVAATMKMNFLMSGAIVGFIALGGMIRHRQIGPALILGLVGAVLIMAPPAAWKHQHYGGVLIDALLTPFPGNWPGTKEFEAMLRTYRDTQVPFPVSLVLPAGPGTVTTVLGLGLFLPMIAMAHARPVNPGVALFVSAAAVVAVLGALLGQRNARFFLEPYLWLLIATMLVLTLSGERAMRWMSGVVVAQSLLVLATIGIGVATLMPGALTPALRESTMDRHASGHAMMKWADGELPPDARIVVEPRSIALTPRFAIANDWRGYVASDSDGARTYLDAVNRQRPDFTLVRVAAGERPPSVSGCADEAYAGPFRAKEATRNPFNSGAEYDAWIVPHHAPEAAECLQGVADTKRIFG